MRKLILTALFALACSGGPTAQSGGSGGAPSGSGGAAPGTGGVSAGDAGGRSDSPRQDSPPATSPVNRPPDANPSRPDAALRDAPAPPPPAPAPAGNPFLVAGSGSEGRLSVFQLDLQTGVLEPRSTNMTGPAPAYAAFHPNGRFLYSVAEGDNTTELEAYSVDRQTLALTRIGRAPSGNRGNTAHVSVHKSGRWAFAAHYNRGFVAALPILDDGGLGMARVRSTGESSQPHQILDDGVTGNFVFVPALIANRVFQFRFDSITGMLTPNTPDSVFLGMGVQPRHMTFHHSRRFAYVFTEGGVNAHSVFSFRYDSTTGLLTENGPPVDGTPPNTGGNGAHILAHPSKDFLYTSNREFGNSTIGVFRIAADGRPEGRVDVRDGLQQPWDFAIDPTGTFLVVASAGNGLVKVFRIDQVTGMLTAVGSGVSFPNPHFVGFMP